MLDHANITLSDGSNYSVAFMVRHIRNHDNHGVQQNGGTTVLYVVDILNSQNMHMGMGIVPSYPIFYAFCNSNERYNRKLGTLIALQRAIWKMFGREENIYDYQLPQGDERYRIITSSTLNLPSMWFADPTTKLQIPVNV